MSPALASIIATLTFVAASAPATAEPAVQEGEAQIAIVGVSVIPMTREVVHQHQTVLVTGQRIEAIRDADDLAIPDTAIVVDGSGRFLLPGLSDMHAHVRRQPGRMPADYLRQGVTVVRNMAGEASHLAFRESVRTGESPGPLLYSAGQPLTSSELFSRHRVVTTADEGRAAVRQQHEAGYDFIKVYSLLTKEAFDGIAAAAAELGIPVVGHVSDSVGLRHALIKGHSSVEHLFGYFWELESADSELQGEWKPRRLFHAVEIDPEKLGPVARLTVEAGAWNCPTLWRKNNHLTFPTAREAWETPSLRALGEKNRRLLVKALHDAGAGLLTGTDDRAEIVHEELRLFVEAGLTPYETLRAATVNAARYLGATEDFGTIEVGQRANLVLLDANPLADIRHTRSVVGVVMNGVWIPASGSP